MKQFIKRILKRLLRLDPVAPTADRGNSVRIPNEVLIPMALEYISEGKLIDNFRLEGNSMRPFLVHRRDRAILGKVSEIKVGDAVIAETSPGHYVLHRIVRIDGDNITLLGDGNITPEHCQRKDVKALALGFYRKGRTTPDMTSDLKWRTYSWIWMHLRPCRIRLLQIHHILFRSLKQLDKQ